MNEAKKIIRKIASRKDLIKYFEKGNLPTAEHFEKLINSNFNKADDRLDIDDDSGLMIYPTVDGELVSFFENSDDENAKYHISISSHGIFISELKDRNQKDNGQEIPPEFFIEASSGRMGVGTNTPQQKLDVNGLIASKGHVGTFKSGNFPADGQWYNIFDENLKEVHAFQIMAYAKGKRNHGKYSLLHAIASSVYGRSKISKTVSHYGHSSNRINIRWVCKASKIEAGQMEKEEKKWHEKIYDWFCALFESKTLEYNLQMRTMRHYGANAKANPEDKNIKVYYKITQLWSPNFVPD